MSPYMVNLAVVGLGVVLCLTFGVWRGQQPRRWRQKTRARGFPRTQLWETEHQRAVRAVRWRRRLQLGAALRLFLTVVTYIPSCLTARSRSRLGRAW